MMKRNSWGQCVRRPVAAEEVIARGKTIQRAVIINVTVGISIDVHLPEDRCHKAQNRWYPLHRKETQR